MANHCYQENYTDVFMKSLRFELDSKKSLPLMENGKEVNRKPYLYTVYSRDPRRLKRGRKIILTQKENTFEQFI